MYCMLSDKDEAIWLRIIFKPEKMSKGLPGLYNIWNIEIHCNVPYQYGKWWQLFYFKGNAFYIFG